MNNYLKKICQFSLIVLMVFLGACVSTKPVSQTPVPDPLEINAAVKPKLPVFFRYSMYRNINEMPADDDMISEGSAGQPVAMLNHRFKRNVFDSKGDTGVGVFLKGFLRMDLPGEYSFKAMSNDGVRVAVNGEVVVIDPTVHSDRFSSVGKIKINKPGWYPLTVKYFQRKGSARLELHWQPPGTDGFVVVPAEVYGHL